MVVLYNLKEWNTCHKWLLKLIYGQFRSIYLVFALLFNHHHRHDPWIHIWILIFIRYQGFRVNYPCPFFGVICMVILHYFIIQNYHKIVQLLPFFTLYGKLPYFMFWDNFLKNLSLNITQINDQKRVTFFNLGIEVLIEIIISDSKTFLNYFISSNSNFYRVA